MTRQDSGGEDGALAGARVGGDPAVVLYCLSYVGTVVLSIIIGIFITALLHPPARWVVRRGYGRGAATLIVFAGGLLLGVGLFALLVPPTVASVTELRTSVDRVLEEFHGLAAYFGVDDEQLLAQARQWLTQREQQITTGAVTGVPSRRDHDRGRAGGRPVGLLRARRRPAVPLADRAVPAPGRAPAADDRRARVRRHRPLHPRHGVVGGAWTPSSSAMALWILGVPIALPLAVLTWVGAFLPVVGAFRRGLLAAVVAFVAKGWLVALIVVGVTVLVQQIEGHVLAPQIYGRALDLPGAVILVAITVGSAVSGIAGRLPRRPGRLGLGGPAQPGDAGRGVAPARG